MATALTEATANAHAGSSAEIRDHWREYAIEGGLLGLFMIAACLVTALLEHPQSPVRAALTDRRYKSFFQRWARYYLRSTRGLPSDAAVPADDVEALLLPASR